MGHSCVNLWLCAAYLRMDRAMMPAPEFRRQETPMSRGGLILGLYSGLALLAWLISAGRDDVDIYRIAGTSTSAWLLASPVLGVSIGLVVVWLSRQATRRFPWARSLHSDFRHLLGLLLFPQHPTTALR